MSGVVVATTMRSTSAGAMPGGGERARARACAARSLVFSSGAAMRRSRMPVRARIHASLVSTRFASSSLVRICAGR